MYHTQCHLYKPDSSGAPFLSRIHHHVRCAPSTCEKPLFYLPTTREYRSPPPIISHPERPGCQKKTRQLFSFEISVLDGHPSASILMGEALLLAASSDGTTGTTKKNQLARQYLRHGSGLWLKIAKGMDVPPRAAEGMFWELGDKEIARRAGTIFSSHHPEDFSSRFSSQCGSISVSDMSERSGGTVFNKKPAIQLPSLKD
ncbi:uncharacterized protein N7446_003939, partial [Penicillium canescens]|uniref:uncharacterized protein n=1 Tax=Penicillium canescens TaxID=5083 RepID=UPI0026DF5D59